MTRAAPPIVAFARLMFTDLLTYRLRYFVGILNYAIYLGVQHFLWSAVYASSPGGALADGGLALGELITYFAIGWVVRASCFNNIDREIAERVAKGDIATDLLRPVSLLEAAYGRAVGESLFRILFMGLPTALILFPLFGLEVPPAASGAAFAARGLAFGASLVLAFHVFFLINFIVGASAVWFERIRGILWAKFVVLQLLSGLLVPFELFPPAARALLEALPFRAMAHAPASIFVGKTAAGGVANELAIQALWVLVLYAAARWFWSRCRRRLLVVGG